jgi:hypothetical protein
VAVERVQEVQRTGLLNHSGPGHKLLVGEHRRNGVGGGAPRAANLTAISRKHTAKKTADTAAAPDKAGRGHLRQLL